MVTYKELKDRTFKIIQTENKIEELLNLDLTGSFKEITALVLGLGFNAKTTWFLIENFKKVSEFKEGDKFFEDNFLWRPDDHNEEYRVYGLTQIYGDDHAEIHESWYIFFKGDSFLLKPFYPDFYNKPQTITRNFTNANPEKTTEESSSAIDPLTVGRFPTEFDVENGNFATAITVAALEGLHRSQTDTNKDHPCVYGNLEIDDAHSNI